MWDEDQLVDLLQNLPGAPGTRGFTPLPLRPQSPDRFDTPGMRDQSGGDWWDAAMWLAERTQKTPMQEVGAAAREKERGGDLWRQLGAALEGGIRSLDPSREDPTYAQHWKTNEPGTWSDDPGTGGVAGASIKAFLGPFGFLYDMARPQVSQRQAMQDLSHVADMGADLGMVGDPVVDPVLAAGKTLPWLAKAAKVAGPTLGALYPLKKPPIPRAYLHRSVNPEEFGKIAEILRGGGTYHAPMSVITPSHTPVFRGDSDPVGLITHGRQAAINAMAARDMFSEFEDVVPENIKYAQKKLGDLRLARERSLPWESSLSDDPYYQRLRRADEKVAALKKERSSRRWFPPDEDYPRGYGRGYPTEKIEPTSPTAFEDLWAKQFESLQEAPDNNRISEVLYEIARKDLAGVRIPYDRSNPSRSQLDAIEEGKKFAEEFGLPLFSFPPQHPSAIDDVSGLKAWIEDPTRYNWLKTSRGEVPQVNYNPPTPEQLVEQNPEFAKLWKALRPWEQTELRANLREGNPGITAWAWQPDYEVGRLTHEESVRLNDLLAALTGQKTNPPITQWPHGIVESTADPGASFWAKMTPEARATFPEPIERAAPRQPETWEITAKTIADQIANNPLKAEKLNENHLSLLAKAGLIDEMNDQMLLQHIPDKVWWNWIEATPEGIAWGKLH